MDTFFVLIYDYFYGISWLASSKSAWLLLLLISSEHRLLSSLCKYISHFSYFLVRFLFIFYEKGILPVTLLLSPTHFPNVLSQGFLTLVTLKVAKGTVTGPFFGPGANLCIDTIKTLLASKRGALSKLTIRNNHAGLLRHWLGEPLVAQSKIMPETLLTAWEWDNRAPRAMFN